MRAVISAGPRPSSAPGSSRSPRGPSRPRPDRDRAARRGARRCDDLCNAAAHLPGADDEYVLEVHRRGAYRGGVQVRMATLADARRIEESASSPGASRTGRCYRRSISMRCRSTRRVGRTASTRRRRDERSSSRTRRPRRRLRVDGPEPRPAGHRRAVRDLRRARRVVDRSRARADRARRQNLARLGRGHALGSRAQPARTTLLRTCGLGARRRAQAGEFLEPRSPKFAIASADELAIRA